MLQMAEETEEQQNERAGEAIESEQAQKEKEERFYDSVGRPRKLAAGAMSAIMREYKKGNFTTRQLAERYGVSVSLILTIVYHTPRGSGRRPKPDEQRQIKIISQEGTEW